MKEASCSKRGTKSYRDVDDEESKRETERDVTKEGVRRGKEGKRRVKGEEERDWRLLAGICWLVARETSIVATGGP